MFKCELFQRQTFIFLSINNNSLHFAMLVLFEVLGFYKINIILFGKNIGVIDLKYIIIISFSDVGNIFASLIGSKTK